MPVSPRNRIMKLRNLTELAGFRRRPQYFDFQMSEHELPDGQVVHFADWQHPRMIDPQRGNPYAFSPAHVAQYQAIVKPGDFCIDIGAHVGDTSVAMGVAVGPSGTVLALEPNPYVYHVLEKNARANRHLANIETLMAAAGPEQGFIDFEYSDAGFCNGGRHEDMSALQHGHPYALSAFCINLDTELQEHYAPLLPNLTFIKVDTEGFDLYILRSIAGTVDAHRPVIAAEIYKKTSTDYRKEMFAFFDSRDYEIYLVDEQPLVVGARISAIPETGHYDILCRPSRRGD